MTGGDLRVELQRHNLSQVEFARLMDVTTRAVLNWTSGRAEVPGPVRGYLRLLNAADDVALGSELLRLKAGGHR